MKPSLRLLAFLCCSGLALAGCSSDDSQNSSSSSTPEAPSANEVDAANWSQLEIDGRINRYDGKTKIDVTGHFLAAHNACAQEDAAGAYKLDFWNPFVTTLNTAAAAPLTGPEQCFDTPYNDTMIDGNVILTLSSGATETLYYPQDSQTCTHLQDLNFAKSLFQTLNQAISTAGMEDCDHPI
jgi:hypothetical protein